MRLRSFCFSLKVKRLRLFQQHLALRLCNPSYPPLRGSAEMIESVFATVHHRTVHTKEALPQKTARLMVFKLVQAAAKKWRRLKGANQLPFVVNVVKFNDGVAEQEGTESRAA